MTGASDPTRNIDRATLKNSHERNLQLKAQELRDVQPGDMPPPTSNKAATSYVDVTHLTPTGDFGSRTDSDEGRAGITGHEEPENVTTHDHVKALNERRAKELAAQAQKAEAGSEERQMGFTDDLAAAKKD